MMPQGKLRALVSLAACAAISLAVGCGGGTQSASAPQSAGATGNVSFSIKFPGASSAQAHARSPKYVSPGSNSARFTVAGITIILSQANGSCSGSGTKVCNLMVPVPTGQQTVAITVYDGFNGDGNQLGSATQSINVTPGQTTPVTVTINGIVASLALSVVNGGGNGPCSIQVGATNSCGVVATAKDADGFTIISPGQFAQPIVLQLSDTTHFSLTNGTISGPGSSGLFAYNGGSFTSMTVGATTGGSVATVTPAVVTPNTVPPPTATPPTSTPSPAITPSPVVTPSPSPSPSPSVKPSGGFPTPVATGTTAASGFEIFAGGSINTSTGVFTEQGICPSASGAYIPVTLVQGSPTPAPTPNTSPTPTPLPSGTYNIYFGMYSLSSGDGGPFYLFYNALTVSNTSPQTPTPPGGNASAFGLTNGIAVGLQQPGTSLQFATTGSVCATVSITVNPSSGSGTILLSNGVSGTISLTSVRSYPDGSFPRVPGSLLRSSQDLRRMHLLP